LWIRSMTAARLTVSVTARWTERRDLSLTVTDTTVFAAGANIGAGTAVGDGTGAS